MFIYQLFENLCAFTGAIFLIIVITFFYKLVKPVQDRTHS